MKVYATSDVHIDSHPNNLNLWHELKNYCIKNPPDILIIAGDLGESIDSWSLALEIFKDLNFTRMIVPGNHDLWCRNDQVYSEDKLHKILPEICSLNNWVYLPTTNFETPDYTFVGNTAWYDYSLMPTYHPFSFDDFIKYQKGNRKWMDSEFCRWKDFNNSDKDLLLTEFFFNKLEIQLQSAKSKNIFLVTHFPFYPEFLKFTGKNWEYEYFGAFMGSKKYLKLLNEYNVKYHVCGHLHRASTTVYKQCQAYLSPIGYHKEWEGNTVNQRLAKRLLSLQV